MTVDVQEVPVESGAHIVQFYESDSDLIAAVGPTLVGALYDVAHNWSLPLAVLLALLVLQAGAGCLAARDRPVTAAAGPRPGA